MSKEKQTIEGTVKSVMQNWYIKKDGTTIAAIFLKESNLPFVDWNRRMLMLPKPEEKVRINYSEWTPEYKKIPRHCVIDGIGF